MKPHAETPRLAASLRAAGIETLDDPLSLGLYATDASMFQIAPLAVALPRNRAQMLAAVRIAAAGKAPILPRGCGTSLSGQTINRAVVIDASKHMNHVLEVNQQEHWARVEPGVVRDNLNLHLKPAGLHFAPDPATGSRANVGGMIGNNAAGMRSIVYGMTIDHIVSVDIALSDGTELTFKRLTPAEWKLKAAQTDREGALYRGFEGLIRANADEIAARYPKVRRRSGGYMLDAFVEPMTEANPWNLAKIIAASEGSLATILEAKLNLEPLPKYRRLCVAHFESTEKMLAAVGPVVAHGPSAVELLDGLICSLALESRNTRDRCGFIQGRPGGGILVIEAQGDDAADVDKTLNAISRDVLARGLAYAAPVFADAPTIGDVWLMRENGLGLMTTVKGDRKPTPFIEDAAVPLDALPEYIQSVREVCTRHGRRIGLFAHASVGLLHVRPLLDLHLPEEMELFKKIQDDVFALVKKHKGSWSGEHGDGLVRGGYNAVFFGPRIYAAFRELKRIFDPDGLMNPGHKIDTPPVIENQQAMRYMPGYAMSAGETHFHYRRDGGLRQAVEQCTGMGVCRQTLGGVMCPSYMATRDEEHSTRGRANALRLAMTGQLPGGLADARLHEALDLCLSCKACVSECPNTVDMARLKAEALAAKHKKNGGGSLRDRIFRDSSRTAAMAAGMAAPLVNGINRLGIFRKALDKFAGIDRRRKLPEYTRTTFTNWFGSRAVVKRGERPGIALFIDTYMQYFEPKVGMAAVEVLEAAGFRVEIAATGCCQRPAISKGFLEEAKADGTQTLRGLDKWAKEGIPVLVCEPSCASALADDLPDLIDDVELGNRIAAHVKPIDQFLGAELAAGRLELPWRKDMPEKAIFMHGHCHHKSLFAMKPAMGLLESIPTAKSTLINAGCCGMAGSFGYESEHYELSLKVAQDRLLPALAKAPAEACIVAQGFSCRHQIADFAGRKARHPVEAVRDALDISRL